MAESAVAQLVEHALTGMAKGGMSQIVRQRDGLGEVFVETQCTSNRAGNLRNFERMGHTGAVMIADRRKENLRFLLQTAKRFTMDDPVAIALIHSPKRVLWLKAFTATRARRKSGLRTKKIRLRLLGIFPGQ